MHRYGIYLWKTCRKLWITLWVNWGKLWINGPKSVLYNKDVDNFEVFHNLSTICEQFSTLRRTVITTQNAFFHKIHVNYYYYYLSF